MIWLELIYSSILFLFHLCLTVLHMCSFRCGIPICQLLTCLCDLLAHLYYGNPYSVELILWASSIIVLNIQDFILQLVIGKRKCYHFFIFRVGAMEFRVACSCGCPAME